MFPGSLVVGQIIPAATASGNWQMAPFALAGIAFVVLVVGAFLLKWQPQEVGLLPDGMTEEEAHRYIQKCSMDSGNTMVESATMVMGIYQDV